MSTGAQPQPKLSIRDDPTFKKLLEIRDSLLHLLDCKIEETSTATIASSKEPKSNLDEDILAKIQTLRANALYAAFTDYIFEKELNKLEHEVSPLPPPPPPSRFDGIFNRKAKVLDRKDKVSEREDEELFPDLTPKEKFSGLFQGLVMEIEDQDRLRENDLKMREKEIEKTARRK